MVVAMSVVTVVMAAVAHPGGAQTAPSPPIRWSAPVDAPIVREFRAPAHRYGPGHRGLDFAVEPVAAVRAAGAGRVTFAGRIDQAWYVTVDHGDGIATTYSYLSEVHVVRGDVVSRGQMVGSAGGIGMAHDGSVMHFGLRVDGVHRDPRLLLRRIVPADVVRLDAETG
jgi:murein DD-endopeptidase MepM/ murein hydrolase activator NlpD